MFSVFSHKGLSWFHREYGTQESMHNSLGHVPSGFVWLTGIQINLFQLSPKGGGASKCICWSSRIQNFNVGHLAIKSVFPWQIPSTITMIITIIHQRIHPTHSQASRCHHCHRCNANFVLFHYVTCYTDSLLSCIHFTTLNLHVSYHMHFCCHMHDIMEVRVYNTM